MRIALLGKRKFGFVTGACSKESCKDKWQEQWETCNAIVLSWLMNIVAGELLGGIVYATSAHKVWEDLKERFDKVNRVRIYQLHREITTLAQGTNFVSTYFSKLKNLWSEYDDVVPSPSCECVRSTDYINHLYQLRLIQFLSGLNDSYDQARRQILLENITPSINQAYAMVIEDEIQHSDCLITATENSAPVAMQSSQNQTYNQVTGNTRRGMSLKIVVLEEAGHKTMETMEVTLLIMNQSMTTMEVTLLTMVLIFFCEQYFYGKLDDPGQVASSNYAVNNAFVVKNHVFTDNEYHQIMGLLNKDTHETPSSNAGNANATCLMFGVFSNDWIVDSGAFYHVAANSHLMTHSHINRTKGDKVNLLTGTSVAISHIGNTPMFENELVQNVLFVPYFRFNLLSVSKLTKELSCFVSFYPDFCEFQDHHSDRVKGIGKENGGFYIY
ncbi:hypothetical protein MTR67_027961 [Solanum verrucosum]|uniref:Retrotransposon gag domain-containing protein n=1 Tax=Solanum verrucosum TaxID=315347 RepID=A0AAF0R370_SOLVR|nr:hypothetical protein MTR67_027961 [Solanum verrucosum]